MIRRLSLIIQTILSYIAIFYCGLEVIEGEYIWIDTFTQSFRGFGINSLIVPVCLFLLFYTIDKRVNERNQDNKFLKYTSLLFAFIMGIGKYYQFKIVSAEMQQIVWFQIVLIPIVAIGYYFIIVRCLKLFLYYLDKQDVNDKSLLNEIVFEKHYRFFIFLTLLICYIPYIFSFYPASVSYDGSVQIGQYLGEFVKTDHHPPFVSHFYGFFASIYEKTNNQVFLFLIIIIQFLLIAGAVILVFKLFSECNIPYKLRWVVLLFYSLLSFFPIFTVTIIKDSIYYPLTVIYTILLVFGLLFPEKYLTKFSYYLALTVTSVLMILTRNNGIYAIILSAPFFIIVSKKFKGYLGIMLIFVMFISYSVTQHYYRSGFQKLNFKVDLYTLMFQQTARYGAEHFDDVTEEEYKTLDEIFEYWRLPYEFNPRNADFAKNCLRIYDNEDRYILEDRFADYLNVWKSQLFKHPTSYISAFIESSYGYYYPDIKEAYEGLGWYNSINEAFNSFHFIDSPTTKSFRSILESLAYIFRDFPIIGVLYSCGFYTWVVMGSTIYLICYKKWKQLIYIVPSIVNFLVCCVSPISGYIRYALPVIAIAPVFIVLIYWNRHNNERNMEVSYNIRYKQANQQGEC